MYVSKTLYMRKRFGQDKYLKTQWSEYIDQCKFRDSRSSAHTANIINSKKTRPRHILIKAQR